MVRIGAPHATLAVVAGCGPAALATRGQATPGVTVTAQNPGTSAQGSDLRITLTAHSVATTQASPSCNPQDAGIRCPGDLMLRIPAFGDLTLSGLQGHQFARGMAKPLIYDTGPQTTQQVQIYHENG
jgi:hypothetical protein